MTTTLLLGRAGGGPNLALADANARNCDDLCLLRLAAALANDALGSWLLTLRRRTDMWITAAQCDQTDQLIAQEEDGPRFVYRDPGSVIQRRVSKEHQNFDTKINRVRNNFQASFEPVLPIIGRGTGRLPTTRISAERSDCFF